MNFEITYMLFVIIVLLAGLIVTVMAYPGPIDGKRRAKVK